MPHDIIIAIDGYSGVGKSSTARAVAHRLSYTYIDTGAMYRAVTLYFLRQQINIEETEVVEKALADLLIRFRGPDNDTYLNKVCVSQEIRNMEVSQYVSPVSALPAVRRAMVAQQRTMGEEKRIVMDGRDIGTHVFPEAALKVFMRADVMVRAHRRWQELQEKGQTVSVQAIADNLSARDQMDSTRQTSPLKRAEDARLLDTTNLDFNQQVQQVVDWAQAIIHAS